MNATTIDRIAKYAARHSIAARAAISFGDWEPATITYPENFSFNREFSLPKVPASNSPWDILDTIKLQDD